LSPPAPAAVDRIDRLLPQTQCTQCGYPRCLDYAAAIAGGEAEINQCPPGAENTIEALAALTGRPVKPLNPDNGVVEPKALAVIDESACIGCRLCIKACPVDCIIGAGKLMHTVLAEECTGCKLCLPVCPTDCIHLVPAPLPEGSETPSRWPEFSQRQVDRARLRTQRKIERQAVRDDRRRARRMKHRRAALQQEIQAALTRKRSTITASRNIQGKTP
jgi:electron transport complex protein RnfB